MDNISHDFVFDYELQEVPGHKSHVNDVANEEIVIANKDDVAQKVTDVNVQAQWYGRSGPTDSHPHISTDSHSHISESYFSCIPHVSLLGVQEFDQKMQDFQVKQVMASHVEYFLPNLLREQYSTSYAGMALNVGEAIKARVLSYV